MRSSTFYVAALAGVASASPRNKMFMDIASTVAKRADWEGSTDLWSGWGKAEGDVKSLLMGKGSAIDWEGASYPEKDSKECEKDTCCIWSYITAELYSKMTDGKSCNDFARSAIRMGFHDAAAWDINSEGGADGSLLLSTGANAESTRFENGGGMASQFGTVQAIFDKYKSYGISMADLLQAGAKVGALACPGGPRIKMVVGRKDSTTPAPEDLLPPPAGPGATAEALLKLFADKTVSPGGLIALLGAHTASRNHVEFLGALDPQDETPGQWDTNYFSVTLKPENTTGVLRFASDVNLANDDRTQGAFVTFSKNLKFWNEAYAKEYFRMSLFGVDNLDELTDCTKAMPKGKGGNKPPHGGDKPPHGGDKPPHGGDKPPHGGGKPPHGGDKPPHGGGKPTHGGNKPPHPTGKPTYTTSTICETSTYTIYSCADDKPNCPYNSDHPLITYSTYPVSTTVYEYIPTDAPVVPDVPTYAEALPYTTSSYAPEATYTAAGEGSSPVKPPVQVAGAARTAGGLFAAAGAVLAFLM